MKIWKALILLGVIMDRNLHASLEVSEAFAMFLSAVHGCGGREFCVHLPILFFSIVDTLVAGFFPMMHDGTAQTVHRT